MVYHLLSLSHNKSLQVSWTLLSILADLINAVVWMIFSHPFIFKSSCPRTHHLVTNYYYLIFSLIFGFLQSFSLYSNVQGNSNFLCFCYWFTLVFIPFFTIISSIVFTNILVNIMSYFITHFFILMLGGKQSTTCIFFVCTTYIMGLIRFI